MYSRKNRKKIGAFGGHRQENCVCVGYRVGNASIRCPYVCCAGFLINKRSTFLFIDKRSIKIENGCGSTKEEGSFRILTQ